MGQTDIENIVIITLFMCLLFISAEHDLMTLIDSPFVVVQFYVGYDPL